MEMMKIVWSGHDQTHCLCCARVYDDVEDMKGPFPGNACPDDDCPSNSSSDEDKVAMASSAFAKAELDPQTFKETIKALWAHIGNDVKLALVSQFDQGITAMIRVGELTAPEKLEADAPIEQPAADDVVVASIVPTGLIGTGKQMYVVTGRIPEQDETDVSVVLADSSAGALKTYASWFKREMDREAVVENIACYGTPAFFSDPVHVGQVLLNALKTPTAS